MPPQDSKTTFLRIPWAASLLRKPNIICRVPNSRIPKSSTEDSLVAETFKTPHTLRSCLVFYTRPPPEQKNVTEVHVLFTIGGGMNGHPHLLHGGIIATLIDEAMGMLSGANNEWQHYQNVAVGKADGELPPPSTVGFTAELKIKYLRPVRTPGSLMVTARQVKREGRKEWVYAEIKQWEGAEDDYDGEAFVCATGEALFIEPKNGRPKL